MNYPENAQTESELVFTWGWGRELGLTVNRVRDLIEGKKII